MPPPRIIPSLQTYRAEINNEDPVEQTKRRRGKRVADQTRDESGGDETGRPRRNLRVALVQAYLRRGERPPSVPPAHFVAPHKRPSEMASSA